METESQAAAEERQLQVKVNGLRERIGKLMHDPAKAAELLLEQNSAIQMRVLRHVSPTQGDMIKRGIQALNRRAKHGRG